MKEHGTAAADCLCTSHNKMLLVLCKTRMLSDPTANCFPTHCVECYVALTFWHIHKEKKTADSEWYLVTHTHGAIFAISNIQKHSWVAYFPVTQHHLSSNVASSPAAEGSAAKLSCGYSGAKFSHDARRVGLTDRSISSHISWSHS